MAEWQSLTVSAVRTEQAHPTQYSSA